MQEMPADRSAQQRAVVPYIGVAVNGRLLRSMRHFFHRPFVVRREARTRAHCAGALAVVTLIAQSSPQEDGYVKLAGKRARRPTQVERSGEMYGRRGKNGWGDGSQERV